MTTALKKALMTCAAVLALSAASVASISPAAAQGQHGGGGHWGGGFGGGHGGGFGSHGGFGGGHGGFFGGHGFLGGYGYPGYAYGYYNSPGYYDGDCYLVNRRVVGRHGRVFLRRVQVCE